MDLKAARIVLRPRKVSEIFDLALRFCFEADRRLYLRLVLALVLPAWALCVGLRLGLGLGVLSTTAPVLGPPVNFVVWAAAGLLLVGGVLYFTAKPKKN